MEGKNPPEEESKPSARLEVVEENKPSSLASKVEELAKVVSDLPDEKKEEALKEPQGEDEKPEKARPERTGNKNWGFMMLAFVAGLGLGIISGYVIWGRGEAVIAEDKSQPSLTDTVTPSPMPPKTDVSPTTTPSEYDLKIQVLNGNGGKGVAAKAKDILTSAGYKTVSTGNSDRTDFQVTQIAMKTLKRPYFESLKKVLGSTYKLEQGPVDLAETSPYDVVITIGKE